MDGTQLISDVTNAILRAKQVCQTPGWNAWADSWLSGADRSPEPARYPAKRNLDLSRYSDLAAEHAASAAERVSACGNCPSGLSPAAWDALVARQVAASVQMVHEWADRAAP